MAVMASTFGARAQDVAGDWHGALTTPGGELRIGVSASTTGTCKFRFVGKGGKVVGTREGREAAMKLTRVPSGYLRVVVEDLFGRCAADRCIDARLVDRDHFDSGLRARGNEAGTAPAAGGLTWSNRAVKVTFDHPVRFKINDGNWHNFANPGNRGSRR